MSHTNTSAPADRFHTRRLEQCATYLFAFFTHANNPLYVPLGSVDVRYIGKVVDEDELVCSMLFKYHSDCEPTVQQADMFKQATQDYAKVNGLTLVKTSYSYVEEGGEHTLLFSLTLKLERFKPRYQTPDHNKYYGTAYKEAVKRLAMPNR